MELLCAKAGRMTAYGITVYDSQLALFSYNHTHDATTVAAILKELAGADGVRKLNNAPAPTGTANTISNQVSLLTQLLQRQHEASNTERTECASAVQSNSDSSANHKHNNRQRDLGWDNECNNRRGGRRGDQQGTPRSNSRHPPNPCPHCKQFGCRKPHPKTPEDRCFWNKRYKEYRGKWICDEMEMAYVPRRNLLLTWAGIPARVTGWMKKTGQLKNFKPISNNKSSFYTSISNYYSILPQYAADPPHTSPNPSKPQFTLTPKQPPPIPIPSTFKHKAQCKALERQARRLRLLNEATLLDRHISWAEDERTAKAKADTTSQQRRAIDTAHTIHPRKRQLPIGQPLSTKIQCTLNNLSNDRHVRFAAHTQIRHYDSQATTPLITFDSGADSHHLSKTDRLAAGLPNLRPSSQQVGIANGSTSTARYVSQLPFPQLSPNAVLADSFVDFLQSLMSVGKTCDDGTVASSLSPVSPSTKTPTCSSLSNANPSSSVPTTHMDATASHSPNTKDDGNRGTLPRRHDKPSAKPTAYTTSHPPNKPSDGCTRCVDTPSSPPGSKPSKPATSLDGHCSPSATSRSTSPKLWKLLKGISTKAEKHPPNRCPFSLKPSSLPNSLAANYATCTLMYTTPVTPSSPTKQANSLTSHRPATIISWSWLTSTRAQSSSNLSKIALTLNSPVLYMPNLHPTVCRRNARRSRSRNFKSHFLSILASVADNFPMKLWDKLLPQAEITINLLRQSNATPTVSAYAHLNGPFHYNKMPLAPMGCRVQVHKKSDARSMWAFHSINGWYLSTSPEHYRTHRCRIKSTNSNRLSDTVVFQHKSITHPSLTPTDKLMQAVSACAASLKGITAPTKDITDLKALLDRTAATSPTPTKSHTADGVPRVHALSNPPSLPRVPPTNNPASSRVTRSMRPTT
eukprot:CCRYP_013859-RA/>CCRYP_013859-RA protein AED:0.31 eAED:0.31 QI:0/0/0/0.8/0.25/0.2/5/0/913